MPEKQTSTESERLSQLQELRGLSALLCLYQTKPDVYQEEIRNTQQSLTATISELYSEKRELEILPAIGPALLSSILPSLTQDAQLTKYIEVLLQLEPEEKTKTTKELVSSFDNILILLGKKASGKGTVGEIFAEQYGVSGMPTSDWLRAVARARSIDEPFNPVMLRTFGDELREEFGGDVLVWLTLQEYNYKGVRTIAFDGLRAEAEMQNLQGDNVHFIWLDAPDSKRLERVVSRNRPGDPKTIGELLDVDRRSFPQADVLREKCEYKITNTTDDMENLRQQVGDVMKQIEVQPIRSVVGSQNLF